MKIAIDLRPLLHKKASGVAVYTREIVQHMIADRDHQFVLFLSGGKEEYRSILDKFEGGDVEKFFFKKSNRLFNLKQIFFGVPKVDKLIGGVDVFFLPDIRPIALSKKCKKVVTCHDLSFIEHQECFSWKSRLWYFLNNPKKYFRMADKVISVSKFTQNELKEKLGVESDVVYEGVLFENGQDHVRKKYNLPEKFLLSLSTIEPRKNLERIVKAFEAAKLEGVELVLAGETDEGIFSGLNLPKCDAVKCVGYVEEEDKKALYEASEGFLYVSLYEGFGLPVLEAMKAGVPVLTSEKSSMEEICEDQAVYVNPHSVKSIEKGIRELLSKKWDSEKLRRQASKFTWKKAAQETLLAFRHIVGDKD